MRPMQACQSAERRKLSNKLANWVEFSKETAEQNEADRRDPQVIPEDAAPPRHGRRAMPGRIKDGIDIQAHVHSELNNATTRTAGYTRYTTGTVNARIARQARKALDHVRTAYGDPIPSSFGQQMP